MLHKVDGFLSGGGEMGKLTREYDWKNSPLGVPEDWPLSLKTTVGIILHSAFPMFLFWGRELWCFYNDAYRPSLGIEGKHPMIGKKGKESWPEIWGFIGPIIDNVIETGNATFFEDQLLPIYRNGKMEDVYWTFTYSPAYGDSGQIEGVFVTCTETTSIVVTIKEITATNQRLKEAELFSENVFYNSPVAKLVFTGRDMVIAKINEKMLHILGRDQSILGRPFIEAIPEFAPTPLMERLINVFDTGETYQQPEERLELIRYGEPYVGYYNYTYKALVTYSGEIYGIMVTGTEVTDQVISRHTIEVKEKELRDLITAAPIGICVVAGDPVWAEEINDRFLLISGKTREQYAAAPYWEVLKEVKHIFKPELDRVFETGEKYTTEEHQMLLIRDGREEDIFLTFEYIPLKDTEGFTIKVIVLVVEVTHQAQTRRQIEIAVKERTREMEELNYNLKRSNAELEQFAYIASHDLQEPIRKIGTFLEMMQKSLGPVDERSQGYFNKIFTSTERMRNLIRDVLAYAQISQNADEFDVVDIKQTIESVIGDFDMLIANAEGEIYIKNLPLIRGIPPKIHQLFSNLISNSIKFKRSGIPLKISVLSSKAKKEQVKRHPQLPIEQEYHCIEFTDNGIGFDQEYADRIFRIFQRLHNKSDYEGTGIGLSICRKIVQNHGGHISASSVPGGGAKFTILLPVITS